MTFIDRSLAIIDQRGEIAKEKLGSFITDKIVDEVISEMKADLKKLLIIKPERQDMEAQHKNQLPENLPYKFTKDIRPLNGEEFKKVCDYDLKYSISNFGRVRDDTKGTILSPNRPEGTGKFYVRLTNKKQTRVQDLIYRAFIGSIPVNMIVICEDGDRRNLTLDNLKLTKASHKRQYKKTTKREKLIPRAKIMQGMQQERTINLEGLTGEEKTAQVALLNKLSKHYYTDTVQNGVYYLKLKNS